MKTPKGMYTDHIDGNSLNNSKSNLRICTNRENAYNRGKQSNNTSGYKGVYKTGKTWVARIVVNSKILVLARSTNKLKLAKIYNEAALKYHGEFAYQNNLVPNGKR